MFKTWSNLTTIIQWLNHNFQTEGEEADEADAVKKNVSPFAKTTILFTRPAQNLASGSVELPAGNIVEFLVGFENKGESDFVVEALDASFRYRKINIIDILAILIQFNIES